MSMKQRNSFLLRPHVHTVDAKAFMHEELTELLIHHNNALPSSQERIYGGGHCAMPPSPFWLSLLVKKNKLMMPSD